VNQPVNWTAVASLARSIWSAVGPLIGVLVGANIANRNQRKHWLLDNRRAEYRKLLTTLTRAYGDIMNTYSQAGITGKDMHRCERVRLNAINVIRDRIFISEEVTKMELLEKWNSAAVTFIKDRNYELFATRFSEVMDSLRRSAFKILD